MAGNKKKAVKGGLTSKEKRAIRKLRMAEVGEASKKIQEADNNPNPLGKFPAFSKFTCKNGTPISITSQRVTDLDKKTVNELFTMVKDNMEYFYDESEWGWSDKAKREEMNDDRARYLIARDPEQKIVAMCHYRFDLDFDVEVLYVYEVQLKQSVRRQGLGKFLMQILELLAFSNMMKKIMLTVLRNNADAMNFFTSLNYDVDETSPIEESGYEPFDYLLLSKRNTKLESKLEKEQKEKGENDKHGHGSGDCCSSMKNVEEEIHIF